MADEIIGMNYHFIKMNELITNPNQQRNNFI